MAGDSLLVKTKLGEYVIPKNLLYTKTDEWVRIDGNIVTFGITDYAQKKLKYVVNVELPNVGSQARKGEALVTLESVKSVADAYSPVDGEVIEVNEDLYDSPDLINKDPYGKGWLVKIRAKSVNPQDFLSPEEYADMIRSKEG